MATVSISAAPWPFFCIVKPKPGCSLRAHYSSSSVVSPLALFPAISFLGRKIHHHSPPCEILPKRSQNWGISAVSADDLASEAAENSQQIVSSGDEGASTVISALLFIAFIGLTILTIGVIYIAVTDFLQKREREKFEKEEAAKKKKVGRKGVVRAKARAGPRGFGQKIEEDENDNDGDE